MSTRRIIKYLVRYNVALAQTFLSSTLKTERKSTLDHIVRMDTFVRKGFAIEEKMISIFFYMKKAYDKTWRYGIMRDIHEAG